MSHDLQEFHGKQNVGIWRKYSLEGQLINAAILAVVEVMLPLADNILGRRKRQTADRRVWAR